MVDANPSCDLPRAKSIERNRQRVFLRKQYAIEIASAGAAVSGEVTSMNELVANGRLLFSIGRVEGRIPNG
jgi:hypothetical protein